MKIRDFILSLVSWFILLVTVSCSDELGGERIPIRQKATCMYSCQPCSAAAAPIPTMLPAFLPIMPR